MNLISTFKVFLRKSSSNNGLLGNSITWDALGRVLGLASAAQIPICGGAFGVASVIIDVLKVRDVKQTSIMSDISTFVHHVQTANQNNSTSQELLIIIHDYSQVLWHFVESMSVEYIRSSSERQATYARKSIEHFAQLVIGMIGLFLLTPVYFSELSAASEMIRGFNELYPIFRVILSGKIKGDFSDCSARLARSHSLFEVLRSCIVLHSRVKRWLPAEYQIQYPSGRRPRHEKDGYRDAPTGTYTFTVRSFQNTRGGAHSSANNLDHFLYRYFS